MADSRLITDKIFCFTNLDETRRDYYQRLVCARGARVCASVVKGVTLVVGGETRPSLDGNPKVAAASRLGERVIGVNTLDRMIEDHDRATQTGDVPGENNEPPAFKQGDDVQHLSLNIKGTVCFDSKPGKTLVSFGDGDMPVWVVNDMLTLTQPEPEEYAYSVEAIMPNVELPPDHGTSRIYRYGQHYDVAKIQINGMGPSQDGSMEDAIRENGRKIHEALRDAINEGALKGAEPGRGRPDNIGPQLVMAMGDYRDDERFTLEGAFNEAVDDPDHPYHGLAWVLMGAFEQAALGKGKERHANELAFEDQKMQTICRSQGHVGGMIYQICKKAMESEKMDPGARIRELEGVIVYAAGAIIFTQQNEG